MPGNEGRARAGPGQAARRGWGLGARPDCPSTGPSLDPSSHPQPHTGVCSRSIISVGLRKEEWRAHSTRTQGPNPKWGLQITIMLKFVVWGLREESNKT